MKYLLLALFALLPTLAHADEASHRAAAAKLLDAVNSKSVMRAAFMAFIDSAGTNLGAKTSPAEIADMKQALSDWFDQDFKWEDLQPKLVDIYIKAFTEDELNQLAAFYKTPVGQKALTQLPEMMKQGAAVGQQYAASKQASLMERIKKVSDKYHAAPSLPGASTAMPSKP